MQRWPVPALCYRDAGRFRTRHIDASSASADAGRLFVRAGAAEALHGRHLVPDGLAEDSDVAVVVSAFDVDVGRPPVGPDHVVVDDPPDVVDEPGK